MNQKLLLAGLLSISLLPLNLTAQTQVKCTGTNCFVDISGLSAKKTEVKSEVQMIEDRYSTIVLDDIETIVFQKEHYIMTDDEVGEYELEFNGIENLTNSVLSEEDLPNSEYYCEDDLKPVKVQGLQNTYECT